jgi:5-methyltetrahydrofolate--homocysteine methyltransferase
MVNLQRISQLISALDHRILVMDGAMGTAIQDLNLSAADFGGIELEGCNEALVYSRPDLIRQIHEDYLAAGCDIIETNTFGSTPLVLDEYGIGAKAQDQNRVAAEIARAAAEKYSTPEKPRFVAGAIGPTTKAISVTGGITFAGLTDNFYTQARGLYEGGVDYFLFETCQDTRNIKAGILAVDRLFAEVEHRIPIAVSVTIEPMGTMLAGQSIEALLASLSHLDLLYMGLNCATGPEFMTDPIRSLAKLAKFKVACVPNAGLPDENGCYLETPEMLTHVLSRFVNKGWINVLGGCCGTHAGHIRALCELAARNSPRTPSPTTRSFLSGIDYLEVTDELRPIIVGERTNVIGSKKFKTLICDEKFEEAAEIGRAQIKKGAQIVDVCLANPDRDELEDMRSFMEQAGKKIRAPFVIDSTDAAVIERALTYCQGKALINSINLEDGEKRFAEVIPLARKYGAALVVGTIDDHPQQGMGITRARKLEIAERSFRLLTEKYGVPAEDIYWDPLVFPCATGDVQYTGSAVETIEGIRLIKQRFPQTKTVLGISNVSFGLPNAGREVLNSVFLYHCVQAGLDLAIVNAEKLERYALISDSEKTLSENLLFHTPQNPRTADPIAEFAAHFRARKAIDKSTLPRLPLLERLPRYIIEGSKDGLNEDLREALQKMKPLEIINGPLMKGMDEVGRLFNANQLIVAEVLQSAEAMKAAVAQLEPFMEKSESSSRGKILLATVKGDVHDIGKNLVEIILANNGFDVVNLGIKVPPEQLIQAIREHQPDIVGLSGLLVKSAQQMVLTAEDFSKAGVSTPILVGGAALSSHFVDKQIAKAYVTGTVAYAQDAMNGLDLAKIIVDPERFQKFKDELQIRRAQVRPDSPRPAERSIIESTQRSSHVPVLPEIPQPPDFLRHIIRNTAIDQIWNFINPLMLYGRHLGIRGSTVRLLERSVQDAATRQEIADKDPKAWNIWNVVQEVKEEYRGTDVLRPSAIYRFFKAESYGNQLTLYAPTEVPTSDHAHDESAGRAHHAQHEGRSKKPAGAIHSIAPGIGSFGSLARPKMPRRPLSDVFTGNGAANRSLQSEFNNKSDEEFKRVVSFDFPRQRKLDGLCLADYATPREVPALEAGGPADNVALFVVTVGNGLRQMAELLKKQGNYLKSHVIQALALESAEAYAELLHSQIRKSWGFPDQPEMTMMERFQAKYRGKRYSFGYPACPRLDDQGLLWQLLRPNDIGVQLTEGFMMDPEASVSALVFHHPDATYFSVGHLAGEGAYDDNR